VLLSVSTTKAVLLEAWHLSPLATTWIAKVHLVEAVAQHVHAIATIVCSGTESLHRRRADVAVAGAVQAATVSASRFE